MNVSILCLLSKQICDLFFEIQCDNSSDAIAVTSALWINQTGIYGPGSDPYDVTTCNMVNIYDVEFATAVNGIIGGEYNTTFSHYNAASYTYVRKFYAPGARYSSRFFYDRLGRLVVSQNARQYNVVDVFGNTKDRQYSYTLYDALGRVVEVGEKTENPVSGSGGGTESTFIQVFGTNVSGYYNPSVIDDAKLLAWIAGTGARKEVTKSYYDKTVIAGLPASFVPNPLTQRKRITHVTYEEVYDGDDQTYAHATHYDYDIHGNVKTLLQDNLKMATAFPSIAGQRFKRLDYTYDLVSGNVHRMSVQEGESDQWHHAYEYDADNRIISAHTSTEKPLLNNTAIAQALENELTQNTDWQQDAKYLYYDHGPLARVELGNNQLQGMDYVYNLQGWMKGVNATSLDQNRDPGKDGVTSNLNEAFAKDVMAFSLHYFEGDYQPIAAGGLAPTVTELPAASIANSDVAANSTDLYNGNIKAMQTTLTHPVTGEVLPMANAYRYDQLNRLLESKSFINLTANQWGTSGMYDNRYLNTFEYDAMGNIVHQNRYTQAGVQIEDMSYGYKRDGNGNLLRNRLYHINEPDALTTLSDSDIDNMGAAFNPQDVNIEQAYNYSYDEEGRLVKDVQENIAKIAWRVDGKVKEIQRPAGSGKKNVSFDYDAMGNRIAKHVYDDDWNLEKSTYYLLDAQGNQMSVYEHEVTNANVSYNLKERHIYGSSSIGIMMDSVSMYSVQSAMNNTATVLGHKLYSMSNHLGNVLTVISDIKIPQSSDGITVSGARVGIRNISDYSPFGVLLTERTVESAFFRLGFQGQEHDDEVSGEGNSYSASYWQYSSRLARRWNIDPVVKHHESPYSSYANNPIWFTDKNGADTSFTSTTAKDDFDNMVTEVNNQIQLEGSALETAHNNLEAASSRKEKRAAKDAIELHSWRLNSLNDLKSGIESIISSEELFTFNGHEVGFFGPTKFGEFEFVYGQGYTVQFTFGRTSTLAHETLHAIQFLLNKTSLNLDKTYQLPGQAYDLVDEYEARLLSVIFDPSEWVGIKQNNPQNYRDERKYIMPWLKLYYSNRGIDNRTNQIVLSSSDIEMLNQKNYQFGKNMEPPSQIYPGWENSYLNGIKDAGGDVEKARQYFFGTNHD